jgi:D-alanine-D-alanine ligase
MKVGVLAGGCSSEHEVSLSTAAVIRRAIEDAGHDTVVVSIDRSGRWRLDGELLAVELGGGLLECDVVFPALHGPFGEDGTVQGLLELLNMPYVGAGVLASALCMDKAAFKDVLAASGVPQTRYVVVHESRWRASQQTVMAEIEPLGATVFVKPARLGSSVGIVKVTGPRHLRPALELAFSHDGVAVVEQFSPGIEVECGVIGVSDPLTSVPGEVRVRHGDWYDYRAKYVRGGHTLHAPAEMPARVTEAVQCLARETFMRIGCSGLARVDFFVENDRVLVNEANTIPGFTPTSDFPKLWEASGLALPELCDRLLGFALERHRTERAGRAF